MKASAMFPKFIPLSIALACSGAALLPQQIAHAAPASNVIAKVTPADLTLEQVFRAKPYAGQSAKVISFSHDGRYLAYVWNPFNEIGSDLYVHDTQTGETRRITSPALMKTFDAPEVWDRFEKKAKQKEKEETERQAKAEAHAAYLRGEKVNLQQWEEAGLEEVKRELADKKARDAKKKAEADAESAKKKLPRKQQQKPVARPILR
jgi:hypothetical protein